MSLTQVDQRILLLIQQYRPRPLNQIFILFTYTGTGRAWFTSAAGLNILSFLGVRYGDNHFGFLKSLFAPLLAWVLSLILKRVFSRRRPSVGVVGLKPLIQTPTCGSFPSAHAAASFAFFLALLFIQHPYAPWVGVWAALVSYSRMYLGVHYASDVGGGIALGFLSSLVVYGAN